MTLPALASFHLCWALALFADSLTQKSSSFRYAMAGKVMKAMKAMKAKAKKAAEAPAPKAMKAMKAMKK